MKKAPRIKPDINNCRNKQRTNSQGWKENTRGN